MRESERYWFTCAGFWVGLWMGYVITHYSTAAWLAWMVFEVGFFLLAMRLSTSRAKATI